MILEIYHIMIIRNFFVSDAVDDVVEVMDVVGQVIDFHHYWEIRNQGTYFGAPRLHISASHSTGSCSPSMLMIQWGEIFVNDKLHMRILSIIQWLCKLFS